MFSRVLDADYLCHMLWNEGLLIIIFLVICFFKGILKFLIVYIYQSNLCFQSVSSFSWISFFIFCLSIVINFSLCFFIISVMKVITFMIILSDENDSARKRLTLHLWVTKRLPAKRKTMYGPLYESLLTFLSLATMVFVIALLNSAVYIAALSALVYKSHAE